MEHDGILLFFCFKSWFDLSESFTFLFCTSRVSNRAFYQSIPRDMLIRTSYDVEKSFT
jgi:hypothetical protein